MKFAIRYVSAAMLLLGLVMLGQAQESAFPNEVEGLQFSKMEKVRDLTLLVSSKDDVAARFGAACVNGCAFNEDWEISFAYVNSGWSKSEVENGVSTVYRPRAEFLDKLVNINFRPRKPLMMPELALPAALKCIRTTTTRGSERFKSRICMDESRLTYYSYGESDDLGKFKMNEIFMITYMPTEAQDRNMYGFDRMAAAK